jgi:hypothetical protein
MFIEVTTGNTEDKKNYMCTLLRTFIETKMKAYCELGAQGGDQDTVKTRYLASLWMVASVTGVLQREEIAEQSGISYSLLQKWKEDKTFNELVGYNYQEFLIYIVNLFA